MLDEFVIELREQGYANGSINRSLSALRAMFYLAQEKGKVRHVPSFPMLPEAKPRQGFFTREEYRRLLTALPVHLKPLLAIGYATGMRVSEIRGLRWSQVDFLNRLITLNPGETKNDEGRAAPITEELDIILRAHRQACPKNFPWVCYFIDAKGHPQRVRTFDVAWNNCCAKIALGEFVPATDGEGNPLYHQPRGPRSKPKPKMKYCGKLFHDLRRVGVRNLVDAGVPETVAMKISGHKTRSIFDRYNIRNQRDVQAAGRALDRFVVEEEKKFRDISGTISDFSEEHTSLKN
jgi:integrase